MNSDLSVDNSFGNCDKSESQIKPMISRPTLPLNIPQFGNKQNLAINSLSMKRPALAIKSITGQTQFLVPVANSSMKNKLLVVPKKNVISYLKPMVKLGSNSGPEPTSQCPQTGQPLKSTQTNSQTPHSTSLLIRSNSKSPKVPQTKSFTTGRTVPKLTDKQMKDHFMMSLGLVTKETLTELQSRKCERKRRTTANPQFSSAALEAKRITKLEIAERKAKRRLLITNSSETTAAAAPTAAPTQSSKTTYLSSGSSPKSIGVEPQEISPGVYIVTSIGKFLSANCYVCDELCEYEIDSILFCKPCKTLFHATCVISKADILEKAALPHCPKCDSVRKKSEEKLAKKRDERDSLLVKKKEFEEQLVQMRRALSSLKIKLKEKSDEKISLVANHEKVQQKVDKIIATLTLVEDTSEWEDGFAAALEATATPESPNKSQTTSSPSAPSAAVTEQMEADSSEQTEAEVEAMNVETSKAAEQLEQLNKASETQSIDMADDEEHQMYELECHENGAEMYDIFVEEVQENVDMVSDGVGFFDSRDNHEQHMKANEEQVIL